MRILNTCGDCELMTVRSEYLWALGFEVESVLVSTQSNGIGGQGEFDLVLLCHTLSRCDKLWLMEEIRKHYPSAAILELYLTGEPTSAFAIEASRFPQMMRSLTTPLGQQPCLWECSGSPG